jgi:hypothetical protein
VTKAKELIDSDINGRVILLDLGEDVENLEVTIPRYTTWLLPNRRGLPPELLALNQAVQQNLVTKPILENLSKSDKSEVKRIIKAEMEKFAKKDKKDDTILVRNVLISLFKTLYTKRGSWMSDLTGERAS